MLECKVGVALERIKAFCCFRLRDCSTVTSGSSVQDLHLSIILFLLCSMVKEMHNSWPSLIFMQMICVPFIPCIDKNQDDLSVKFKCQPSYCMQLMFHLRTETTSCQEKR